MDSISEEEYLLAIKNVDKYKNELFNLRLEHSKSNDVKTQELIQQKIKIIKRELSRTLTTIKTYEFLNERKEHIK